LITLHLPAESVSPFSLDILLATILIFIIVIYSTRFLIIAEHKREKKKEPADSTKSNLQYKNVFRPSGEKPETPQKTDLIAEITSIGGLFATILGGSFVSLIVFPLVDYSAPPIPQNSSKVTIEVRNIGFTSAKNVVVSLHADGAKFYDLRAEPYVGEEFKKETTSSGDAYGKLATLAPTASAKINGFINASTGNDATVTPYVFSDEVLGKVNSLWTDLLHHPSWCIFIAFYHIVFCSWNYEI
jgi:hypothetical protein